MATNSLPTPGAAYRLLGRVANPDPRRRLGCGIMDKSGRSVDFIDLVPGTWSLVWILRGRGTYEDAHGTTWTLTDGDVFQRWPGRRMSVRIDPDSGYHEAFLDLGRDLHEGLAAIGVLDPDRPVWHLGHDRALLDRWLSLRETLATAVSEDLPNLCLLAQILASDTRRPTAIDDPLAAACRMLGDPRTHRDDLHAFCQARGLDHDAFRKRFRRATGLSPGQYRLRRRMERACALLLTTTRTIGSIAEELGYASPFEFSAQFRRHCGQAPRAWRQIHGEAPIV